MKERENESSYLTERLDGLLASNLKRVLTVDELTRNACLHSYPNGLVPLTRPSIIFRQLFDPFPDLGPLPQSNLVSFICRPLRQQQLSIKKPWLSTNRFQCINQIVRFEVENVSAFAPIRKPILNCSIMNHHYERGLPNFNH